MAGSAPHNPEAFLNLRAEMLWGLRLAILGGLAVPPDLGRAMADEAGIQRKYNRAGRMQIESKDEIKARIGRSTDHLDALALTCVEEPGERVIEDQSAIGHAGMASSKPIVWREPKPNGGFDWRIRLEGFPLAPRSGELLRGVWFAPRGPSACVWAHRDGDGTITVFDALISPGRVLARDFGRMIVDRSRDAAGKPHDYVVDAKSATQDRLPELDQTLCDELDRAMMAAHDARREGDYAIPLNVEPGRLDGLAGWGEIQRMIDGAGKEMDQMLIWPKDVRREIADARFRPDRGASGEDLETETVGGGGASVRCLRLMMVCWGDLRG
jgi:hypothetical protein